MPISLDGLLPEFRERLEATLATCAAENVTMTPYTAVRSPFEQGKLWRQSRSRAQVVAKIADLRDQGADFLAHCIESVGPQHGPPVTGVIPGNSWHQWGEAVDCYWLVNGDAEWDTDLGGVANGYKRYAFAATSHDLTAGGYWQSLKDWPHVQLRHDDNPLASGMSLLEIDARMRQQFG